MSESVFNFRNLMTLIFFIALSFIVLDIGRSSKKCPEQKTIYKFVPRTFSQEQNDSNFASTVFKNMFEKSSPWVNSFVEVESVSESN